MRSLLTMAGRLSRERGPGRDEVRGSIRRRIAPLGVVRVEQSHIACDPFRYVRDPFKYQCAQQWQPGRCARIDETA
ncbi:unnamed protein product (plasmid) [Mycetohabitans rhizoxinica HKI 454]|uniref:Uncharacterized protein n=1 Tax=Mycetohabitans rhizoxinica (strain DSM 19002 / CIP 109453 / HKI 454) TaxID=882378 RepID=E5ATL3_MYCRK|nr:unnamed protein product [Mycetohabitans rhizoxinica HKI 454]